LGKGASLTFGPDGVRHLRKGASLTLGRPALRIAMWCDLGNTKRFARLKPRLQPQRNDIRCAVATHPERCGVSRLARATLSRVVAARAAKKWMVVF